MVFFSLNLPVMQCNIGRPLKRFIDGLQAFPLFIPTDRSARSFTRTFKPLKKSVCTTVTSSDRTTRKEDLPKVLL